MTVADDQRAIEDAIRTMAPNCDVLIISGGIGPTPDDLTRQALAAVMKQPLELNEHWLHFLKEFFNKRNREMPEMNKIQAMIPRGAKIILNSCGTAAGIEAELVLRDYIYPPDRNQGVSEEYLERMFGEAEMDQRRVHEEMRSLLIQTQLLR